MPDESRNVQLLKEYLGALQASDGEKMASMGSYDQTYHWLFTFRDDQIVEILEYIDILAVWKTFGTPEQKAIAKAATEAKSIAA
jgi:ketosteroid isomerase-like protein